MLNCPALFVEEIIHSPLSGFGILVRNQSVIDIFLDFKFYSTDLYVYLHDNITVLDTIAL